MNSPSVSGLCVRSGTWRTAITFPRGASVSLASSLPLLLGLAPARLLCVMVVNRSLHRGHRVSICDHRVVQLKQNLRHIKV